MATFTEKEHPSNLEHGSDSSEHGDKASAVVFQNTDDTDLPDPDEGKSEAERAKIVSGLPQAWTFASADALSRTAN